jgi:hypothetical protein
VALVTRFPEWHTVAVVNVRAGAAFAVASAGAGRRLSPLPVICVLVWGANYLRPE